MGYKYNNERLTTKENRLSFYHSCQKMEETTPMETQTDEVPAAGGAVLIPETRKKNSQGEGTTQLLQQPQQQQLPLPEGVGNNVSILPPFPSVLDFYRIPYQGGKFHWQELSTERIRHDHLWPLVLTLSFVRDLRNLKLIRPNNKKNSNNSTLQQQQKVSSEEEKIAEEDNAATAKESNCNSEERNEEEDTTKDERDKKKKKPERTTGFGCPNCDKFHLVFRLATPMNAWCLQVEESEWEHKFDSCLPTVDVIHTEVFENLPCILSLMRTNQIMAATKSSVDQLCKSVNLKLKLSETAVYRSLNKLKGFVARARRFPPGPPTNHACYPRPPAAAGYPLIPPPPATDSTRPMNLQEAQIRLAHMHQRSAQTASILAIPPTYTPQHPSATNTNAQHQKKPPPPPSPATKVASEYADIRNRFNLPAGWSLHEWRELMPIIYKFVTDDDAITKGYYSIRGFAKIVLGQPNKSSTIQTHWNRSGLKELTLEKPKVPADSPRVTELILKAFPDSYRIRTQPYGAKKRKELSAASGAYIEKKSKRPDAKQFAHIQKRFKFPDDLPKHLRHWKPAQWRELMFTMYVFLTSEENERRSVKFFCKTVLKQPCKENQIQTRWKDSGLKDLALQGELSTSEKVSDAIKKKFPDIDPEEVAQVKKAKYEIIEELKIAERRHKEPLKFDSVQWRRLLFHLYKWFMTTPEASIRRFANKVLEMPEKRYALNDYWRESGLAALFEQKEPADSPRVKAAIETSFPIQGSAKKQEEINNLFLKTFAKFTDKNGRRPTLEHLGIIQRAVERKGERQRGEILFSGTLKAAKERRKESLMGQNRNDYI